MVEASGVWLDAGKSKRDSACSQAAPAFVPLEACVWDACDGEDAIWAALKRVGCRHGDVVDLESEIAFTLEKWNGRLCPDAQPCDSRLLCALSHCAHHGMAASTVDRAVAPPLPYPTGIELMLKAVLPWLLEDEELLEDELSDRLHVRLIDHLQHSREDTCLRLNLRPEVNACFDAVVAAAGNGVPRVSAGRCSR